MATTALRRAWGSSRGRCRARCESSRSVEKTSAGEAGRKKVVARAPNGTTAVTYVDADDVRVRPGRMHDGTMDKIIELKAVGATPEYIAAMRAAAPRLARLEFNEFTSLRAVGVTPDFARSLVAAGFRSIDADGLMEARAIGVTGEYVQAMRNAGVQGDMDDFVQLRAVGVDPAFATRVRASGIKVIHAEDLVQLKALGTVRPPVPPHPPAPPHVQSRKGLPAASPPDWDPPGG